jgi:hypothetical protein
LLSRLEKVRPTTNGWDACCPAHADEHPSLGIRVAADFRILLHCRSQGCSADQITRRLGLGLRDLYPPRDGDPGRPVMEAVYDYRDEAGVILYQVVRYRPKAFRQRRPGPNGSFVWSLGDVPRVLYRLPELQHSPPSEPVFIVEGEKDADSLTRFGLVAVTNAGGAGKWRPEFNQVLRDRHAVLLPDNDEPGRRHAAQVAEALAGIARSIRIVTLPGLPAKGDVSDWLATGGTAEELRCLAEQTPPQPPAVAGPDAWGPPLPLSAVPAVAPFPLDVLPASLRRFAQEAAEALGCPVDYVTVPMLAVAGGAIGQSRALALTRTHEQRPSLYAAIVGPTGSLKTPAQKLVVAPLHEAQRRHLDAWRSAREEYERRREAAAAAPKPDPDAMPDPDYEETMRALGVKVTADAGPLIEPILKRVVVADCTCEALALVLEENPRGVLIDRDELTAWVLAMNAYRSGKGADRQFFLSAWAGREAIVDRKNSHERGPIVLPYPFLCVVGGLPPALLYRLQLGQRGRPADDDGFLDRLLFCYPEELPCRAEHWLEVSDDATAAWRSAVEALAGFAMEAQGGASGTWWRPHFLRLTATGRQAWERFTQVHADEMNAAEFPAYLRGPWSKLRGYGARLALIVHCLRQVCGEAMEGGVDGECVDRAARLVSYFKSHARKVYAAMDADPTVAEARRVLECLAAHPEMDDFTRRDLYQHLRYYCKRPEALDAPLRLLVEHGYLRSYTPERAGKRGPNPVRFVVHPSWDRQITPQDAQVTQVSVPEGKPV